MNALKICTFVLLATASGCNSFSEQKSEAQNVVATDTIAFGANAIKISCGAVGEINMGDTYQDVVDKAAKENVVQDSVFLNGAFQHRFVTKVWKGTAKEITINWQENEQPYKNIQSITIDFSGSNYTTANGIKIGAPMSLVNKLNGNPFILIGFAGQNAGTLMNFNGGDLITQIPCMRAVFKMPATELKNDQLKEILTSNIIQSNHVLFKSLDPTITKLIINSKR